MDRNQIVFLAILGGVCAISFMFGLLFKAGKGAAALAVLVIAVLVAPFAYLGSSGLMVVAYGAAPVFLAAGVGFGAGAGLRLIAAAMRSSAPAEPKKALQGWEGGNSAPRSSRPTPGQKASDES